MVNEPGKLTAAQRAREKEHGAGQFVFPQGEEEESYEQLLDQYGARKFAEGEVMKGTVLKITDTEVIVDIGYKSEGVIPVTQFIDATGHVMIKVGESDDMTKHGAIWVDARGIVLEINSAQIASAKFLTQRGCSGRGHFPLDHNVTAFAV